jgi:hypothetical protein
LTGEQVEEVEEEQGDDDVCEPGIGRWKGITGLGEEYDMSPSMSDIVR